MTKATQRKATANHRKRIRAKGLVRVEVQVPEQDAAMLRDVAAALRASPDAASAIRKVMEATATKPLSALDIYASDLPDEYFEGVFDHVRTIGDREVDL